MRIFKLHRKRMKQGHNLLPNEKSQRGEERREIPVVRSTTAGGVVGARVFEEDGSATRIMTARGPAETSEQSHRSRK